jgi:hypothetical protein
MKKNIIYSTLVVIIFSFFSIYVSVGDDSHTKVELLYNSFKQNENKFKLAIIDSMIKQGYLKDTVSKISKVRLSEQLSFLLIPTFKLNVNASKYNENDSIIKYIDYDSVNTYVKAYIFKNNKVVLVAVPYTGIRKECRGYYSFFKAEAISMDSAESQFYNSLRNYQVFFLEGFNLNIFFIKDHNIYKFNWDVNDKLYEISFDEYYQKKHLTHLIRSEAIFDNYEEYYKSELADKPPVDTNAFQNFKNFLIINERKVKEKITDYLKVPHDGLNDSTYNSQEIKQLKFIVMPRMRYLFNAILFKNNGDNLLQYFELDTNKAISDFIVYKNDTTIYYGSVNPHKFIFNTFKEDDYKPLGYNNLMIKINKFKFKYFFQIYYFDDVINIYINKEDKIMVDDGTEMINFDKFFDNQNILLLIQDWVKIQNSFSWPEGFDEYRKEFIF